MTRPKFWKIRRELNRVGRQLRGGHRYFANYLAARPYYDLVLAREKVSIAGQVPFSRKIAIYLIFPKDRVLRSHIAALDYLLSAGYSPLVVSNLPMSDGDRSIVLQRASLLLIRPNFGYDFGGYRDAVLEIGRNRLGRLDRLVLVNDSTWFPLPGATDWLRDAEALGVDYAAASWHGAVAPRDPEKFEFISWTVAKSRRNFHYASYALSVSNGILSSPDFWRFWKNFRLTNEKHRTVRRGEIGLTQWVIHKGFSHQATTDLQSLDADLRHLTNDEVNTIYERLLLIADQESARRWQQALTPPGGQLSRAQKELAIIAVTAREGAVYALADYLVRRCSFAFLKKSPIRHDLRTAAILMETIERLPGAFGETVLAEAREIYCETIDDRGKAGFA